MNANKTSRRRDPAWDDLRIFLAVARAPSLAAGASSARVDKSTVSRRVAHLEAALGVRLFARTREGLRLTEAGKTLRVRAQDMEQALAAARRDLDDDMVGQEVRGVVRVATTEALAAFLVERGILDLCTRHPRLSLELLAGNAPLDLVRGDADIALRLTKPEEASLKVRRLAAMPVAAFASAQYVQARGHPRRLAQLEGHDLLVVGGELSRLPMAKVFDEVAAGGRARVKLRSSSLPALAAACAAGHGVALLTQPWGQRIEGLVELFLVEEVPVRPLWLAFTEEQGERRAVRVVVEQVASIAGL